MIRSGRWCLSMSRVRLCARCTFGWSAALAHDLPARRIDRGDGARARSRAPDAEPTGLRADPRADARL